MDESKPKRRDDWAEMLREIDELWYHLMKSGQLFIMKNTLVSYIVSSESDNILI